jgi:hypothetical protein
MAPQAFGRSTAGCFPPATTAEEAGQMAGEELLGVGLAGSQADDRELAAV